ncbi:hypothetical protein V1477_017519 [Vespula maculifrons]|uniref:Uncharacterized protein n=1 Tax=Vespula maculifrons TaxID=7453 RepID=A0ABD2B6A8_VESMC
MQQPPSGGTWVGNTCEYTEIFADAIPASINEQLIQIYNSLFDFRLKCEVGIHGFERRQQYRLCIGLRAVNLEIFADAIRASINEQSCFGFRGGNLEIFADAIRACINEQLIQIYNNLNAKWGYTASKDENNIGSLVDLYSSWFSCALDFEQ